MGALSAPAHDAPPRAAAWLVRQLLPRHARAPLAEALDDEYRTRIVPVRTASDAHRWYWRRAAEHVWDVSRVVALVAALSFVVGTGIELRGPESGEPLARWGRAMLPFALLVLMGVRGGWRTGAIVAPALGGAVGTAVGTAGVLTITTIALAFAQPALMKIGLSWASLRDLLQVLAFATTAGTVACTTGGALGALGAAVGSRPR